MGGEQDGRPPEENTMAKRNESVRIRIGLRKVSSLRGTFDEYSLDGQRYSLEEIVALQKQNPNIVFIMDYTKEPGTTNQED